MCSSLSAFGFSQVFLFFFYLQLGMFVFCLLLAMFLSCLLLALLLYCLLLALLFRFFSSFSPLPLGMLFWFTQPSDILMPVPFSFFDSAGRFARVLRTYSSAHSAHPEFGPLSIVVHRRSSTWCCVRQSGVASFLLLVTTGAVGRGSFSVLCLNSLAAHRDLSHWCAARHLLRAARSSSITLW